MLYSRSNEEVPKTIGLLSATTFVSEVDSTTLSLMVPLLSRGPSEKLTATKRKVVVITDNIPETMYTADLAANLVHARNCDNGECQTLAPYLNQIVASHDSTHITSE